MSLSAQGIRFNILISITKQVCNLYIQQSQMDTVCSKGTDVQYFINDKLKFTLFKKVEIFDRYLKHK